MVRVPLEKRVSELETKMGSVEALAREALNVSRSNHETLVSVKETTDTILDVVTYAKSGGKFLAKHGPRVIAALSGAAVSAGLLNPAIGQAIRSIFG